MVRLSERHHHDEDHHRDRRDGDNINLTIGFSPSLERFLLRLAATEAGQGEPELSDHDAQLLQGILFKVEQRTKMLEALDALTPPKSPSTSMG